ncbi:MAG: D-alanyl-D-alanine dipeptidase [Kovacikia sp.]
MSKKIGIQAWFLVLMVLGMLIAILGTSLPQRIEAIVLPTFSSFINHDRLDPTNPFPGQAPVGVSLQRPGSKPKEMQIGQARAIEDTALINLNSVSPKILLDIRYATKNNFTHSRLYSQARCVLRAEVARQLSRVQMDLERQGLGLKVYDCYRPLSIQKLMWKAVPNDLYVANPRQGSRHNRGSAVDLTLVDGKGRELEMPTGFDDFSERAHADSLAVSAQAQANRQLLKQAMEAEGFISLETEWWHFDAKHWEKYSVLDISLDTIP